MQAFRLLVFKPNHKNYMAFNLIIIIFSCILTVCLYVSMFVTLYHVCMYFYISYVNFFVIEQEKLENFTVIGLLFDTNFLPEMLSFSQGNYIYHIDEDCNKIKFFTTSP